MSMSVNLMAIFLSFVFCCAMTGLLRGFHKSWIKIAWTLISVLVAVALTSSLSNLITTLDISQFKFDVDGEPVKYVTDFFTITAQKELQLTPEETIGVLDFATKTVNMLVGGFVFLVTYLILKIITAILNPILCAILRVKKWSKTPLRPLGLVMNAISGILTFVILLTPITGYCNVLTNLPKNMGDKMAGESTEVVYNFAEEYENTALIRLFKITGIYDLQLGVFDGATSTTIKGTKISLTEESEVFGEFLGALERLDLEQLKNPDAQINVDEYADALSIILNSKLLKIGIDSAEPVIQKIASSADEGGIVLALVTDLMHSLGSTNETNTQEFKQFLSATLSIVQNVNGLTEENFESFDFEGLGADIDDVLESGYISKTTVGYLFAELAKTAVDSLELEGATDQIVESVVSAIEDDSLSFEKELRVVEKLMSLNDAFKGEEFDFSTKGEEVGAIIDDIVDENSVLINKAFINNFISTTLDNADYISLGGDFDGAIATIKDRLDEDFSYEQEFGYLQILLEIAQKDIDIQNINQVYEWADGNELSLGKKLDQIAPSVLCGDIGITAMDKVFERYEQENQASYGEIISIVKSNYDSVKEQVVVCGKTGSVYIYGYDDLASAFDELFQAISAADKITDNTQNFDATLAQNYEEVLDSLQDNILVGESGAREVAKNVAKSIREFVVNTRDGYHSSHGTIFDSGFNGVINYVDAYIDYLNRTNNLSVEPYVSEVESFVSYSGKNIRVNKPFSYIFEKLSEVI
ncbi:MAG: CvpA family protein [Clostridia bacterium]|nr:CvpA family protein [Clostridia bacterium]